MFDTNELILLPLLSTIRYYVFSYDVIHSLGIYSFGIKIDSIPGRFNFTSTIRTLIKGEHRGMCYELCGQGHSSMLIIGSVIAAMFVSPMYFSIGMTFP
jgi:heme/copper-type cytochrome/quinol oxidase subunit 2